MEAPDNTEVKTVETPPVVETPKEPEKDEPIITLETEGEPTAKEGEEPEKDEPIIKLDEEEGEEAEEVNEFNGSPETYEDFELPANFTLDEAGKAEVGELFKKLNLSQKGGQELINAYTDKVLKMKENELNQLAEQRKQWRSALRSRPNYASERATVIKGLNAVVKSPEAKALFTDTWLCDHPAVFETFLNVGQSIGEDTPISVGRSGTPDNVNLMRFPQK